MKNLIALTLLSTSLVHADTLAEKLKERASQKSGRMTPEMAAENSRGIETVRKSGITEKAKNVGDKAPAFTLKNATGMEVTLADELKKGPVVLTWYRGGWCPYCNIAMAAMQEKLPEFKAAGASLIALTPELPDKALTTTEKNELEFQVLTDLNNKVADEYGLVFTLTPEVEKIYGQFFDLAEFNGKEAGTNKLPLAATYIIARDGTIKWAFVEADYRSRAEPADIVAFLKKMK
ncbi:MAG: peroxiredoxin-like family protein [Verrucomicrobiaceae bacterium]